MYSFEIVNEAISAVAAGFSCSDHDFKESVKGLPEEIQALIIASVLAGHIIIHTQMKKTFSKASNIEKKLKVMKNPTEDDVQRLFEEALEELSE